MTIPLMGVSTWEAKVCTTLFEYSSSGLERPNMLVIDADKEDASADKELGMFQLSSSTATEPLVTRPGVE